jgi:hypothetical protein
MIKNLISLIIDNKESMWQRRAKRQWIKEGDKNTSIFHTMATIQKRQHNSYDERPPKETIRLFTWL